MNVLKMHHAVDPAAKIRDAIGDLGAATVLHNEILVGVYLRPDAIDVGGGKKVYLPDGGIRDEDRFQGKVGLVLAMGPLAFVDDEHSQFAGQKIQLGDWVVFHAADGWALTIRGVLCRMVKDNALRMVIPSPDFVY